MIRYRAVGRVTILAAAVVAAPAVATPSTSVVDHLITAFAAKDLPSIQAEIADDATLTQQAAPDAPVSLRGKPAISAYFATVFARYKTITLTDIVKTPGRDGRTVVVEATGRYETFAGESHTVSYVWIITVRGGRIVASRNYVLPLPNASAAR